MKNKKILAILLVVCLLLSLSACGSSKGDGDQYTSLLHDESQETVGETDFTFISGFSEGLAFGYYKNDITKTYCIDKKGKIRFSLDGNYMPYCGFSNGIAMIYTGGSDGVTDCIVDTKGKLTYPKDLGGTQFIIDSDNYEKAFADGYILLCKSNSDFTGSNDEAAIFNSQLKVVVPFSKELFDNLNQDLFLVNGTKYYNGVLYFTNGFYGVESMDALFLNTGKIIKAEDKASVTDLFKKIGVKNESDFWIYNGDYIIDEITYHNPEAVNTVLSNYKDTLYSVNFENGKAGVIFRVQDSEGLKYYFTVMGETGKFNFEPIEVISNVYQTDGKSYLFKDCNSTIKLQMVNSEGKTDEYSYQSDAILNNLSFSDGVVVILDYSIVLDEQLERLF